MQEQIIKHYTEKRDGLIKLLHEKFDTFYDGKEDDLSKLLGFINDFDGIITYFNDYISMIEGSNLDNKGFNESIQRLLFRFTTSLPFDEDKARKTLINGLIKVVINKQTFNGSYFSDGKHINTIIKKD